MYISFIRKESFSNNMNIYIYMYIYMHVRVLYVKLQRIQYILTIILRKEKYFTHDEYSQQSIVL